MKICVLSGDSQLWEKNFGDGPSALVLVFPGGTTKGGPDARACLTGREPDGTRFVQGQSIADFESLEVFIE
jgi:hypothetical protein